MRILKPLLIGIVGLFLMLSLIALCMPSEVRLVRTISIHVPADSIDRQLEDFSQWPDWQTFLNNPSLHYVVAQDGQSASWKQNGKTCVVSKMRNADIKSAFKISVNDHPAMEYYFTLPDSENQSVAELQWAVILHTRWYPWERFSGLLFEQTAGPGIESALQQLKLICEK